LERKRTIRIRSALDVARTFLLLSRNHVSAGAIERALGSLTHAGAACQEAGMLLETWEHPEADQYREHLADIERQMRELWETVEAG